MYNSEMFGKVIVPKAVLEKIIQGLKEKQRALFITTKQYGRLDSAINQAQRTLKNATKDDNCIISKNQLEFLKKLSRVSTVPPTTSTKIAAEPITEIPEKLFMLMSE